jgi:hypothetical protein
MKLHEIIKHLVELAESDDGDYFGTVHAIALIFPSGLKEQLRQLVNGPVWDGDVMSKAQRGELFDMGIAIRVCSKGEQGHTGAKCIGYSILKKLAEITGGVPNSIFKFGGPRP